MPLHKATSLIEHVNEIKSWKTLGKLLTITGTIDKKSLPVDGKQWLLLIFIVYIKEISVLFI